MSAKDILLGRDRISLCLCANDKVAPALCQRLANLPDDQREFCQKFLTENIDQFIEFSAHPESTTNKIYKPVEFKITDETLLIVDPETGQGKAVPAMTKLGPEGPVYMNRALVRSLSPAFMLALMTHELGHKISLLDEKGSLKHVEDEEPIGPFTGEGGGRMFLDTVGSALAIYAAEHHRVGNYFGIKDLFECTTTFVLLDGTEYSSGAFGYTERQFAKAGTFEKYRTGVGLTPTDFQCYFDKDEYRYYLKMMTDEDEACATSKNGAMQSSTKVEIWRLVKGLALHSPTLMSQESYPVNPLCKGAPSEPLIHEFGMESTKLRLKVRYLGSSGSIGF
jgi:hypothetical protein